MKTNASHTIKEVKVNKGSSKQGNYSLRRPPKLVIPQAVIGQRWATVYSNLYKQTVIHSKSTS